MSTSNYFWYHEYEQRKEFWKDNGHFDEELFRDIIEQRNDWTSRRITWNNKKVGVLDKDQCLIQIKYVHSKKMGFFTELKYKFLFSKIRNHFKTVEFVHNNWTIYKYGKQKIRMDFAVLYIDGNFVMSDGIPLYNLKTKQFIA